MSKGIGDSERALFALICAGLWEHDVELRKYGATDFNKIMRLAQEQAVVGLVAAGIEHVNDVSVPLDIKLQLAGAVLQIEQRNKAMNAFVADLIEKLRKRDVYALLVKGQGIAQYYEKPLWRCSGDIDLFLSDENYQKAKTFLISLTSEVETEYEGIRHLGMTINGWEVELHGSLRMGLPKRINRELDKIYRDNFYNGNVRSWNNNGTQVFMLSKENDIVYVFAHFLNHFYKGGIGLRQICDWCRLLWTYRDEIDIQKIEQRIKKMGLITEWKAFGAFAVEYLGMPIEAIPLYSPDEKWKKKANSICSFIMEVGNFGHNRDMSYYGKYPYLLRKCCSMWMRMCDLFRHAKIFPLDSLKFFPWIMFNGVRSAVRGE